MASSRPLAATRGGDGGGRVAPADVAVYPPIWQEVDRPPPLELHEDQGWQLPRTCAAAARHALGIRSARRLAAAGGRADGHNCIMISAEPAIVVACRLGAAETKSKPDSTRRGSCSFQPWSRCSSSGGGRWAYQQVGEHALTSDSARPPPPPPRAAEERHAPTTRRRSSLLRHERGSERSRGHASRLTT